MCYLVASSFKNRINENVIKKKMFIHFKPFIILCQIKNEIIKKLNKLNCLLFSRFYKFIFESYFLFYDNKMINTKIFVEFE